MNLSNSMGLSPSSFRRVLTAHGRSTTPGLLQSPIDPAPKRAAKPAEQASANMLEIVARAKSSRTPVAPDSQLVNMPVSKMKENTPAEPVDSYSFYKRSFRVHGKQAWEYAMRDLGSIDTLLNRYGYVEPDQRMEVSPVKVRQVGDSSATLAAALAANRPASGAADAGATPTKPTSGSGAAEEAGAQ